MALVAIDVSDNDYYDWEICKIVDQLVANPNSVVSIKVSGNCLEDETGRKLAEIVRTSTTLTHLYMNDNCFGAKTFSELSFALLFNRTLRVLDVSNNPPHPYRDQIKLFMS